MCASDLIMTLLNPKILQTWMASIIAAAIVIPFAYAFAQTTNVSEKSSEEPMRTETPLSPEKGAETPDLPRFLIRQYKVVGAKHLSKDKIERAVYPFLGPYCSTDEIEKACNALEKTYQELGYQTIAVQAQPKPDSKGIVMIKVDEMSVGRLRVRGSKYFDLDQIKKEAPSLAEGQFPNFNDVTRDIIGLNRLGDRRITPAINSGKTPGTLDVDLIVKDSMPLHGNFELNNRYSPDTSSLRFNSSLSYHNLWQLGHTVGVSYQMSPLNPDQVESLSGFYLAPVPEISGLSLMLQGSHQDSNVTTLGTINSVGKGDTLGARAMLSLPGKKNFYHSAVLGFDYKYADTQISLGNGTTAISSPVTYFPWSANYSSSWIGTGYNTDFNGGVTFGVRELGSDTARFENRRSTSDGNFIYFRGDISHLHEIPLGFQTFNKIQGQVADRPLISNEEFSGGGLETARGYLESLYVGDNAIFGTAEIRSPSIGKYIWDQVDDWRLFAFVDAGQLVVKNPLPEQTSHFDMASWGVGSKIRVHDNFNAAITLGVPMIFSSQYKGPERLLTFRVWYEF